MGSAKYTSFILTDYVCVAFTRMYKLRNYSKVYLIYKYVFYLFVLLLR